MKTTDPAYDPQNADLEAIAHSLIERDPDQLKVRGPSNDGGDDGIHRHRETGEVTVSEAKFLREDGRVPMAAIDRLWVATKRAGDLYHANATGVVVSTAEDLRKGAKSLLRKINKDEEVIKVVLHKDLKAIAQDPATDPDLAFRISAALAKKSRGSARHENL